MKKTTNQDIEKDLMISKDMAAKIYKALDDKQGVDIKILDIHEVSILADYFLIAHGNNPNHLGAMMDEVIDVMMKNGFDEPKIEGHGDGTWVLMDFGRVIVHIFSKEARLFYDLERIWSDSRAISPDEL